MSGACFKDISNSETLILKHRLPCKAAQNIAPYKVLNQTTPQVLTERWKDKHFQVIPMFLVLISGFVG